MRCATAAVAIVGALLFGYTIGVYVSAVEYQKQRYLPECADEEAWH